MATKFELSDLIRTEHFIDGKWLGSASGKRFDVTGMNPALLPLFAPQLQGFLINAFSYDPAKLIATISKPMLILQGERDLQVSVADAERLKQAAPQAKLVLLANTNHVLKTVTTADPRANAACLAASAR